MTSGGARNRSGPQKDPNSGRSDRLGYTLTALPSEGYTGEVPEWPLMPRLMYQWEYEDKRRYQVLDAELTQAVAEREAELWQWAWSTPQACAWSMGPWRWQTVAMWVRTFVTCESGEATAADKGSIHRFADQIGLTPAGLKENGWAIAADELKAKADENAAKPTRRTSRSRLTVVKAANSGG